MKGQVRSLLRSAEALFLSFLFGLGLLLPTASAQGIAPSGAFGFQTSAWVGPDDPNPAAFIGVMNFDGAGKVTGSFTAMFANPKPGPNDPPSGQGIPGTLTGTYSSNSDGTGQVSMTVAFGSPAQWIIHQTVAMVITDGGAGLQVVETDAGVGKIFSGTARAIGTVSSIPANTSYGYQFNRLTIFGGQQGVRPEVIIGTISFDGSGNVTARITDVFASQTPAAQTSTVSGTYSTNGDGTGQMSLNLGGGQAQPVAFVITDSGAGCYLLLTADNPLQAHPGIGRRQ